MSRPSVGAKFSLEAGAQQIRAIKLSIRTMNEKGTFTDAEQKNVHQAEKKLADAKARLEVMGLQPRGLARAQAAAYIGVGATKFDEMVEDGRMPKPKRIDGRTVWDRHRLDMAFSALPDADGRADDVWGRAAV